MENYKLLDVLELFNLPFNDLIFRSATIHRKNNNPNQVQVSSLLSIKTGSCPEDCKYCPQSSHYNSGLKKEPFMDLEEVVKHAKKAKDSGASRFCMGAAWRNLNDRDLDKVCDMIKEVNKLGLESCVTLGMINGAQAEKLKDAGLDYYNHNIDSSEEFYKTIITTRKFEDRLNTLKNIEDAKINVCSGGIVGMGESREDRAKMLMILASLPNPPKSVPINMLVKTNNSPLSEAEDIDHFEFIKTIAVARILMPTSAVRLSAGRSEMNEQTQSLCFLAGANSIFYGEKLLTTENPEIKEDKDLFKKLGIQAV
jgi:biotin synthase|tara:strand:+ start:3386 stop:4318 length:933 start_codon:yes stop_codon:yes gene_type:complete